MRGLAAASGRRDRSDVRGQRGLPVRTAVLRHGGTAWVCAGSCLGSIGAIVREGFAGLRSAWCETNPTGGPAAVRNEANGVCETKPTGSAKRSQRGLRRDVDESPRDSCATGANYGRPTKQRMRTRTTRLIVMACADFGLRARLVRKSVVSYTKGRLRVLRTVEPLDAVPGDHDARGRQFLRNRRQHFCSPSL
jgi:hypothetical protein